MFTRMPDEAYSFASPLVRLMPAARVTAVGTARAAGALPPTVVTLMMTPPPRFCMIGMLRRQNRMAAISLSSMSVCHVRSSTSMNAAADEVPALFSRISTPPKRSAVAFTTASTSSARVTSAGIASTSPPACRISPAVRSSTSLRRAQMLTRAPSRASFIAAARPSPALPPVTIATLPVSSRSSMGRPP